MLIMVLELEMNLIHIQMMVKTPKIMIIAAYASYKITDTIEGLLRYDMHDPNIDTKKDGDTYLIAGLNHYPTKGLIITPNILLTTSEADGIDGTTHAIINFHFKF